MASQALIDMFSESSRSGDRQDGSPHTMMLDPTLLGWPGKLDLSLNSSQARVGAFICHQPSAAYSYAHRARHHLFLL
eukprot:scaffold207860_cov33-Tisochrysis_lutea.AAC.2